jgi:hypothetical protein
MILLEKLTKEGIKFPVALPIANIMEVTPNMYEPTHSWVTYKSSEGTRPMVVVGTVEEIVDKIHAVKQSYMV